MSSYALFSPEPSACRKLCSAKCAENRARPLNLGRVGRRVAFVLALPNHIGKLPLCCMLEFSVSVVVRRSGHGLPFMLFCLPVCVCVFVFVPVVCSCVSASLRVCMSACRPSHTGRNHEHKAVPLDQRGPCLSACIPCGPTVDARPPTAHPQKRETENPDTNQEEQTSMGKLSTHVYI